MDISIIIPAKNELKNLEIIIPKILNLYPKSELIIIDGGNDKTNLFCEKYNLIYQRQNKIYKSGKADAMRQGALIASNPTIVFFDADCSHDPSDIKKLVIPIIKKHFKHTSGSRSLGGSSELFDNFSHIFRLAGSIVINSLISLKFNFKITDAQNGLRAFEKKFFIDLNSQSIHTTIEQELVCLSLSRGEPILEIPTHEYKRLHGVTKINLLHHSHEYVLNILKHIFFTRKKRKTIKSAKFNLYQNTWW